MLTPWSTFVRSEAYGANAMGSHLNFGLDLPAVVLGSGANLAGGVRRQVELRHGEAQNRGDVGLQGIDGALGAGLTVLVERLADVVAVCDIRDTTGDQALDPSVHPLHCRVVSAGPLGLVLGRQFGEPQTGRRSAERRTAGSVALDASGPIPGVGLALEALGGDDPVALLDDGTPGAAWDLLDGHHDVSPLQIRVQVARPPGESPLKSGG